jgi:hypothetical protein
MGAEEISERIDLKRIVVHSWQLVKQNRLLWLLGLVSFLGTTSRSGSDFELVHRLWFYKSLYNPMLPDVPESWLQFLSDGTLLKWMKLALAVVLWFAHFVSQAGLIKAAARLEERKTITLRQVLANGVSLGRRVLALNLLLFGFFYLLVLVRVVLAGSEDPHNAMRFFDANYWNRQLMGNSGVLLVGSEQIACCALLPLNILVMCIYPFAQRAIVLQEHSVLGSVRHGWRVLRQNALRLLPIAVLVILISYLAHFVIVGLALILEAGLKLTGVYGVVESIMSLETGDPLLSAISVISAVLLAPFNIIIIAFSSVLLTLIYLECIRFLEQH